jgi:restriction system protein
MYDYEASNLWPIGYTHFAEVHEVNTDWMREAGITNHEPHLQLRGTIAERKICPTCGWWIAIDKAILPAVGSQLWLINLVCSSVLLELDSTNVHQPLEEVRNFLARRYESRHSLNPRVYEEAVASVFRDLGYRSEVTAYSNDGGIDVVLFGSNDEKIGVQVKRQKRSIEVAQIRAFLGALTLEGYTRGAFVATSRFSRGAIKAAERSSQYHISIELIDADRFFDMLGIAQLSNDIDPDTCCFYQTKNPKLIPYGHFNLASL